MEGLSATDERRERCPCCGRPLPLGLFSRRLVVELPFAVAAMEGRAGAPPSELMIESGELAMLEAAGRSFCRAGLPLPLGQPESPVRALVWIELEDAQAGELIICTAQGMSAEGPGRLACDLPGFPGLLGAFCRWRSDPATGLPRITWCADQRISSLPEEPGHDELAAIYRMLWGNHAPVAGADPELRAAVIQHWHRVIPQPLFRRAVEPPPRLAGFEAPQIAVAPPLDTGGEAVLATIGCSERPGPSGERCEMILWAEDPSEEFIGSFSEFCFLSRMNSAPIKHGKLVPETGGIPGTAEMKGWLLARPWWFEDEGMARIETSRGRVDILCPIPLYESEMAFAHQAGPEKLIGLMRESEAKITDLRRRPVLEPITPA